MGMGLPAEDGGRYKSKTAHPSAERIEIA